MLSNLLSGLCSPQSPQSKDPLLIWELPDLRASRFEDLHSIPKSEPLNLWRVWKLTNFFGHSPSSRDSPLEHWFDFFWSSDRNFLLESLRVCERQTSNGRINKVTHQNVAASDCQWFTRLQWLEWCSQRVCDSSKDFLSTDLLRFVLLASWKSPNSSEPEDWRSVSDQWPAWGYCHSFCPTG